MEINGDDKAQGTLSPGYTKTTVLDAMAQRASAKQWAA